MNFKRVSRNSWRREPGKSGAAGRLGLAKSQQSLDSEEYRSFKKHGFPHKDLEGLKSIPTYQEWKDEQSVVEDSNESPRTSISLSSSQETLAPGELHHEAQSRRTSDTDSLKHTPNETEIEKGSIGTDPSQDRGRARPEVFDTTWKEIIFICCILVSLSMAVSRATAPASEDQSVDTLDSRNLSLVAFRCSSQR